MRYTYKCGHVTPDVGGDDNPTLRDLYTRIPCRDCARRVAVKNRLKTILLDERHDIVLRILAVRQGVSQAEIVRRLIYDAEPPRGSIAVGNYSLKC